MHVVLKATGKSQIGVSLVPRKQRIFPGTAISNDEHMPQIAKQNRDNSFQTY